MKKIRHTGLIIGLITFGVFTACYAAANDATYVTNEIRQLVLRKQSSKEQIKEVVEAIKKLIQKPNNKVDFSARIYDAPALIPVLDILGALARNSDLCMDQDVLALLFKHAHENGYDFNSTTGADGYNHLGWAMEDSNLDYVEAFVDFAIEYEVSFDWTFRTRLGMTLLHYAQLLHGNRMWFPNKYMGSVLAERLARAHGITVKLFDCIPEDAEVDGIPFIDLQDAFGCTALMLAAYYGDSQGVSLLLERGADTNITVTDEQAATFVNMISSQVGLQLNPVNFSALTCALYTGHKELLPIIEADCDSKLVFNEQKALILESNPGWPMEK